MEESKARNYVLDGVRGLAVLLVYFSHASGRSMSITSWLNFHGIGHIGVYLFFGLSGFLLTKSRTTGQNLRSFFIHRFFRIAPLYYLVLFVVFAKQMFVGISPKYLFIQGDLNGFVDHLLFLKGDSLFWTIPAEFIFYMALPFIVWINNKKLGTYFLSGFALFYFFWYALIRYAQLDIQPLRFVEIAHPTQFIDVFILGVFSATIRINIKEKTVFYIFCAALLLSIVCVSKNFLFFNRPFFEIRHFSILYGLVFSLAIASAANGNKYFKIFSLQPLRWIGKVGFSWYLLHFPVMQVVNSLYGESLEGWEKFIITTFLLVIVSSASFKFIEVPFIKIGREIASSHSRETARVAGGGR